MKKITLACCLVVLVCFSFTVCQNQIIAKWWDESEFNGSGTGNNGNGTGNNGNGTGNNGNGTGNNGSGTGNNGNETGNPGSGIGSTGMPVTITGLSAKDKVYDGTTEAFLTGTPVLNGVIKGDDVTLVVGTAAFEDANTGADKNVRLNGWSLGGADSRRYTLETPVLKAGISKADPDITWPCGLVANIGQTLSELKLPANGAYSQFGTFVWTRPADSISNVIRQLHNMTFIPDDTANYNTLTHDVEISIVSTKIAQVPAGSFLRGSPANEFGHNAKEEPMHKVVLRCFYMSEYPVTQELYEAVMGVNPSKITKPAAGENAGRLPVENVRWYDAIVFCNKLSLEEGRSPAYRIRGSTNPADWGNVPVSANAAWDAVQVVSGSNGYRLPTEAQWEYACRAGTTTAYNTGSVIKDSTGWYGKNSGGTTHEVGLKPANAWGLYDMHGNVYEWCWDWLDDYKGGTATDPAGPVTGKNRILRGGAYGSADENVRSANRRGDYPYAQFGAFGFRIVLPLP
jgi:formylglycine-generating enzyme required for sulfatase activity